MLIIAIPDSALSSRRESPALNPYQDLFDDASTESSSASNDPSKLLLQSVGQMMSAMAPLFSILAQLLQQMQQLNGGGARHANGTAQGLCPMLGKGGAGTGGLSTGGLSTEPATGPLSEAESKAMAATVCDQLMRDFPGLTKEQAAGIAGNLYHESDGMNSNINEYGSGGEPFGAPNSSQFGYGWAQWTGDRKAAYLDFCQQNGLDPSSPAANYAMLKHELETSENGTLQAIQGAQTPEEAAGVFRKVFERAANPVDEKRIAAANMIYGLL